MKELREFLIAAACAAACCLAMAADSAWVANPGATYLAAVIFIPLACSVIAALLLLLNLAAWTVAAIRQAGVRYLLAEYPLRVIAGRPRHDDARIAELERALACVTAPAVISPPLRYSDAVAYWAAEAEVIVPSGTEAR